MIQEQLPYLIALSRVKGIGDLSLTRIMVKHGDPESIFKLEFDPTSTWERRVASAIKGHAGEKLLKEALVTVERLTDLGGHVYTILDEGYPLGLLQLAKAPPILYVQGELRPDDKYAIAVVGTRMPTDSGRRSAYALAGALAKVGIAVISGLALGIDTAAHRGALSAQGRTIAVIGSGLDHRYPPENSQLWDSILAADGAIVSQFAPGTEPRRWTFPQRNWTMSGMAQGTVVVEASDTSGAKLQAEFAAKQGRLLFLTKKQVKDFEWARQIAEDDGAIVVRSVDDIIDPMMPSDELSQLPSDIKVVENLI